MIPRTPGSSPKPELPSRTNEMTLVEHHIAGARVAGGSRRADIFDPNTGQVARQVAMGDRALLDRAVAAAEAAQPGWAATNPQRRARVLFRFKELVKRELEELAHLLASEHGKVVADARGAVQRGLAVIRSEEGRVGEGGVRTVR